MKGYAKVTVNTEHREKIADLIEKIESDKEALQKKYDQLIKDDSMYYRFFLLFRKIDFTYLSVKLSVFEGNTNSLVKHCDLLLMVYKEFITSETDQANAIRKLSHLTTKDDILLDDELMAVWNEYIEE